MRITALLLTATLAASPVVADEVEMFSFGGDTYQAGRSVAVSDASRSVFAAGEAVKMRSDISGSAHLAAREVVVEGAISQNLYGAGMDVDVYSTIAGDASVMGYDVAIHDVISGNLRATGSTIEIGHQAKVLGSAMLAGETVTISGSIQGDLAVAADDLTFTDGAVVGGQLDIYTDAPSEMEVPEAVAAAARVTVHDASKWDDHGTDEAYGEGHDRQGGSFGDKIGDFFGSIVAVGIMATILAALTPNWLAGLRGRTLADPARATWYGFLGLSALVGSIIGLALTGVGIVLAPFALIAAILLGAIGYIVGAYVLGVWVLELAGRAYPETTADRALAGFTGAAALAVIGLAPYLGWLVALAVGWAGAGSVVMGWFAIEVYDAEA